MPRLKSLFIFLVVLTLAFAVRGESRAALVAAATDAWSGYWWPYVNGGLATGYDYRGFPAPLEKYELLVDGYLSDRLVGPYLDRYYDPDAPNWYGLCNAWAAASTFEKEPAYPSVHENILFRVGDKKGLYTLAHTDDVNLYGDGDSPAEFHRWLTTIIGQQHEMFYADLDAGPEVWSYPIYAYDMSLGPRVGNVQSVEVTVFYADDFVSLDFVGTDVLSQDYAYTLIYNDLGTVVGGEWTGASVSDHPQLMTYVREQRSKLSGLDMVLLRQLGESVDDEMESSLSAPLSPGSYQMISLNEDRYWLSGGENDSLTLTLEKLPGPEKPLTVQVLDGQGLLLDQTTIDDAGERLDWRLSGSLDHRYQLRVLQPSYTEADFYQLDFSRHSLEDELLLPYIPANGWWLGFSFTNLGNDDVEEFCLTGLDLAGKPLESHVENQKLAPREKLLSLFSLLPSRLHERFYRETLSVLAPPQVATVYLFGGARDGLGGFFSGQNPASRLQLPLSSANWSEVLTGGLINRSVSEQTVQFSVYAADGSLVAAEQADLLSNEKVWFNTLPVARNIPAGGWLDVVAVSGEACLDGFQIWRSIADVTKLESVRGLQPARVQWLPHVAEDLAWSTELVIINPSATPLTLTVSLPGQTDHLGAPTSEYVYISPFEKRTLSLPALFPAASTTALSRCAVRVSGSADFSGYAVFRSPRDLACIPLLPDSQLSSALALPHVGAFSDWWTGVALFNSQDQDIDVRLTPVKSDGTRWVEEEKIMTLLPGEKAAFLVWGYFSAEVVAQMAYMEMTSENGGEMGGLFLFGRLGYNQVAGSLLPVLSR